MVSRTQPTMTRLFASFLLFGTVTAQSTDVNFGPSPYSGYCYMVFTGGTKTFEDARSHCKNSNYLLPAITSSSSEKELKWWTAEAPCHVDGRQTTFADTESPALGYVTILFVSSVQKDNSLKIDAADAPYDGSIFLGYTEQGTNGEYQDVETGDVISWTNFNSEAERLDAQDTLMTTKHFGWKMATTSASNPRYVVCQKQASCQDKDIANGKITKTSATSGKVSCNSGYTASTETVSCNCPHAWSSVTCDKIDMSAVCKLGDALVDNGFLVYGTTDSDAHYDLSQTLFPVGATVSVICKKGYEISGGTDTYVTNTCIGGSFSTTITCKDSKARYGLKAKEARAICGNKFDKSVGQRCGFYDKSASKLTAGPCDASDRKQRASCPFFRQLRKDRARRKNYNFCSCLLAE